MLGGKVIILCGENSFEKASELSKMKKLAEKSGFLLENLNADILTSDGFISAIAGVSLFSEKRFVVVKNLSEKSEIWQKILEIIPRVSADVCLCLVEEKLDRRTKFAKDLAKISEVREFKALTEKDSKTLAEFARKLAKLSNLNLDLKTANFLISWVGVNEWEVRKAVEKLAILGDVSEEKIRNFVPQNIENNVFGVFENALNGDFENVKQEFKNLRIGEDIGEAMKFWGLLISQFSNLVALKIGKIDGLSTAETAKEIGANAWALGKMEKIANNLTRDELSEISQKFALVEEGIKNESVNPWDLIEGLILEIATKNFKN